MQQGKLSLHEIIREDIRKRIQANEWPPGCRIPFEHELMVRYDCSRMTVNKAITSLVNQGILERRRKAGTFVVYPSTHRAIIVIPDIRRAILEAGFTYAYSILYQNKRVMSAEECSSYKCADGTKVLEVISLHNANGRPYAYEARRINLAVVPDAERTDFFTTPPSIWLLTHVPWTNAEHEIKSLSLTEDIANIFRVSTGSAALHLHRRTFNDIGIVTDVDQYFLSDDLTLKASFSISEP
ncbi:MAG: UTRA domain-containing protein [Sphingobium sp.]